MLPMSHWKQKDRINVQRLANLNPLRCRRTLGPGTVDIKTLVDALSVSMKSDLDNSINPGGLVFPCHGYCFKLLLDYPALSGAEPLCFLFYTSPSAAWCFCLNLLL